MVKDYIMMLTPEAAETIRRLVETPGADGLRISRPPESVDGVGPSLQIELVAGAQPEDSILEAEGARIYLDAEAEETMEDKVLHVDVDDERVRFEVLVQPGDSPT